MIQQDDIIYIAKDRFNVEYQNDPLGGKIILTVKMQEFPSVREVRIEMTPDTAIKLSQGLNINCQLIDEGKPNDNDR